MYGGHRPIYTATITWVPTMILVLCHHHSISFHCERKLSVSQLHSLGKPRFRCKQPLYITQLTSGKYILRQVYSSQNTNQSAENLEDMEGLEELSDPIPLIYIWRNGSPPKQLADQFKISEVKSHFSLASS